MAGRGDIMAGRAFVSLFVKNTDLINGLKKASESLMKFGTMIGALGASITAMGTSIVVALEKAVVHFANLGDEANKAAQRTGATTNAISELGYAAGQSGSSLAELESGFKRMQSTIADAEMGLETAKQSLGSLGISLDSIRGKTPDEQLEIFADALSGISDPGTRAALAMDVFGKSGVNLLPLFSDGAAGIRSLRQEAVMLGQSIDPADAQAATDLGDEWDRVKKAVSGAVFSIGGALAPTIQSVLEPIRNVIVQASNWIRNNKELVLTVAKVGLGLVVAGTIIAGVGSSMIGLSVAITTTTYVIGTLATAFTAATAAIGSLFAFVTSAPVLVTAAVAAAAAWLAFSDSGRQTLAMVRDAVMSIPDAFTAAVESVVSTAGRIRDSVSGAFRRGIEVATGVLTSLRERVTEVFNEIAARVRARIPGLADIASQAFSAIGAVAARVGAFVSQAFRRAADIAGSVWSNVATLASGAWSGIVSGAQGAVSFVGNAFTGLGSMISAAWSSVASIFTAAWESLTATFGTVWGGIKDAVMSGDLALAGQIAITGLRLVFAEGMAALASMVGGIFGDTIGKIGTQITGGDFAGAWETAVKGMAAIWDAWSVGVVKTFTSAARAILDFWKNTVSAISNLILSTAAQGGIAGAAISKALGVDVQAEQIEAEQARLQRIDALRRNIATQEGLAREAGASGDLAGAEKFQESADDIRRSLQKLEGTPVDILGDMGSSVDQQLGASLESINSALDLMERTAQDKATASGQALGENVGGAATESLSQIDQLRQELEALRGQASAKREALMAGKKLPGDTSAEDGRRLGKTGGDSSKQIGSFSAAALMAGGGPQERMTKIAEDHKKISAETKDAIKAMQVELARQTGVLAAFTGVFKYG